MQITIRQETVNLFHGKENFSILQLSDIHLLYSTRKLAKIEALIAAHNPAIIVATGDYYDIPRGAYNFREFLKKIAQRWTIIFIKGNHDTLYGTQVSNLLLGIPNCFSVENEIYKYQSSQGCLYNFTSWKNRHKLPSNSSEKNIVLMHNPEKINDKELANIQVILAGHLHGGQFIFFKTKKKENFPGCLLYKHCSDRKQIHNTTIIVSKGLGDTFPFRLNCPKEMVKILIE